MIISHLCLLSLQTDSPMMLPQLNCSYESLKKSSSSSAKTCFFYIPDETPSRLNCIVADQLTLRILMIAIMMFFISFGAYFHGPLPKSRRWDFPIRWCSSSFPFLIRVAIRILMIRPCHDFPSVYSFINPFIHSVILMKGTFKQVIHFITVSWKCFKINIFKTRKSFKECHVLHLHDHHECMQNSASGSWWISVNNHFSSIRCLMVMIKKILSHFEEENSPGIQDVRLDA